MREIWEKITAWFIFNIGKIRWTQTRKLHPAEIEVIKNKLANDYYLIMTRRHNWVSAYLTYIAHFLLTGKFGQWSHVLMNVEGEVKNDADYRLVEAVRQGVKYSSFNEVFDKTDGVMLLRPKNMSLDKWTLAFDEVDKHLGKPYDTLFDLINTEKMSCVELIREVMKKADPEYDTNFAGLEKLIRKHKNLTPQMFVDCGDFIVEYHVRH